MAHSLGNYVGHLRIRCHVCRQGKIDGHQGEVNFEFLREVYDIDINESSFICHDCQEVIERFETFRNDIRNRIARFDDSKCLICMHTKPNCLNQNQIDALKQLFKVNTFALCEKCHSFFNEIFEEYQTHFNSSRAAQLVQQGSESSGLSERVFEDQHSGLDDYLRQLSNNSSPGSSTVSANSPHDRNQPSANEEDSSSANHSHDFPPESDPNTNDTPTSKSSDNSNNSSADHEQDASTSNNSENSSSSAAVSPENLMRVDAVNGNALNGNCKHSSSSSTTG